MLVPSELRETLQDVWPPKRVTLVCGDCEDVLWDSATAGLGKSPVKNSPVYVSDLIRMEALQHQSRFGDHDDFDVNVFTSEPLKEIEATVEVKTE